MFKNENNVKITRENLQEAIKKEAPLLVINVAATVAKFTIDVVANAAKNGLREL